MHDFLYNELLEKAMSLREQSFKYLDQPDFEGAADKASTGLSPLKIAFVGQYSAGKSSLIKMLTGIQDIEIGAGVTTGVATPYEYKGLHIVDTPGIRAKHCETHDLIAQKAIDEADLLIFVITNELFDDVLGAEFRRMCFDGQRQREMMIVINKSQNDPGSEQTKLAGITVVLDPLIPENFPIVFTDAASYFDALGEDDPQERDELLANSNRAGLVEAFDSFVARRGLYARITTPVQGIQAALQRRIETISPATPEDESVRTLLRQSQRLFKEGRRSFKRAADGLADEAHSKIIRQGNLLADAAGGDASEFDRVQSSANIECKAAIDRTVHALEELVNKEVADLEKGLEQLAKSPLGVRVLAAMRQESTDSENHAPKSNAQHRHPGDRWELDPALGKTAAAHAKSGLDFLAKSAVGDASKQGLKQVSGSALHEAVKKIGELAGYKFDAWEAVKIADFIGKGAKFLGPALAIAGLGLQLYADGKQSREAARLLAAKREIRKGFMALADQAKTFFDSMQHGLVGVFDKPIAEIDDSLEALRQKDEGQTAYAREVSMQLIEVNRFLQHMIQRFPD